jgi:hypothetical protein
MAKEPKNAPPKAESKGSNGDATKPKKPKAPRVVSYAGPAGEKQHMPPEKTLRARCIALLQQGFKTIKDVEALCADFDKERNKESKTVHRRAHELVKLVNKANGFAIEQNEAGQFRIVS